MDNKEEHVKHQNEWEVVSLTSSAYAASPPGPYNSRDAYYGAENSRGLFMSDHFVFPPSQHENLPLVEEEKKDGQGLMLEAHQGLSDKNIYGEPALSSSQHMVYEHELTDSEPNEYADKDLDPLGLEKDGKKRPSLRSLVEKESCFCVFTDKRSECGMVLILCRCCHWTRCSWSTLATREVAGFATQLAIKHN
ncbi:hypothetical protein Bca101_040840 [Brassica carinata]